MADDDGAMVVWLQEHFREGLADKQRDIAVELVWPDAADIIALEDFRDVIFAKRDGCGHDGFALYFGGPMGLVGRMGQLRAMEGRCQKEKNCSELLLEWAIERNITRFTAFSHHQMLKMR